MSSTIKKLPKSQVEISFSLDPAKLEAEREVAFSKLADQVKVPGFRPGRAPRKMIEERINPSAAMQQALDVVMNLAYQAALKEHDIVPVAQPEVNIESVDYSKPIAVTAIVQIRPEAEVGDYSKIKATKNVAEVTEDKLNDTMKTIFERSTSAPQQPGHTHEHDHDHDHTHQDQDVLVGADGKPLSSKAKPDMQMDDDWAKTLGAKNLEDLRNQVKADLESAEKYEAENKWQDEVMQALIDMTKVELPEAFVEDELSRMRANYQQQLSSLGITMEDYLKQAGKDQAEMEAQWRPQAEKQAILEVALAEVAKKQDIQIEESEVEAELAKVDAQTQARFADPQQRYYLTYSLWRQKVLQHILDAVNKSGQ